VVIHIETSGIEVFDPKGYVYCAFIMCLRQEFVVEGLDLLGRELRYWIFLCI